MATGARSRSVRQNRQAIQLISSMYPIRFERLPDHHIRFGLFSSTSIRLASDSALAKLEETPPTFPFWDRIAQSCRRAVNSPKSDYALGHLRTLDRSQNGRQILYSAALTRHRFPIVVPSVQLSSASGLSSTTCFANSSGGLRFRKVK